MKTARLRWTGHVIEMSDSEMSKRIINYNRKTEGEQEGPTKDELMLLKII
jgi:hypothetical protein